MKIGTLRISILIGEIAQVAVSNASVAGSTNVIDERSRAALKKLCATTPAAKKMGAEAKGTLVFPQIGKGEAYWSRNRMGPVRSTRRERRRITTTPLRFSTASTQASKSTLMHCSL